MRAAVAEIAILAVDGGNSKTDIALVSAGGEVLGAVRGAGASHQSLGVEGALDGLGAMITTACLDAGLDPAARPLAQVGVWCLAGLDLPADEAALAPAIAKRRWAREDLLRNDTFAVLRAGTERTWGVGVVVGAGMNCAGVAPDGTQARFPALGPLSGDWGGGHHIGIDEVVTMATAAIRRLGLADRDPDVVLGGGLFQRHDPGFLGRIRAGIAAVAPAAVLRQLTAPPVVGAALLGVDRLRGGP